MLAWNLAGNADIEKLQQQLNAWAKLKGGLQVQVTGQLDTLTLLSSIQVIPQVASSIPVVGNQLKTIIGPIKSLLNQLGGYSVAAMALLKSQAPQVYAQIETQVGSGAGYVAEGIKKVLAFQGAGVTTPGSSSSSVRPSFVAAGKVVQQALTPVQRGPEIKRYPSGTIHYFNTKKKTFVVAVPTLDGSFQGLGAYGEPLGADFERKETTDDPAKRGSTASTKDVVEGKFPFYKKWWFWPAVGGVVIVIGGGTWYLMKRRS